MHPYLARVFGLFPGFPLAIVGSAARDVSVAGDIDILVLDSAVYPALIHGLGLTYSGWDAETSHNLRYHLRRCNLRLPDIPLPCQLLDYGAYTAMYPYAMILRDGAVRNPGMFFTPLHDASHFIERPVRG